MTADGAEIRRLSVGAPRDPKATHHQIESFSGVEGVPNY
jgi:hypothetical protein